MVCAMLKSYELPVLIQFSQNILKQELTLHSQIHKCITSIRNTQIAKVPEKKKIILHSAQQTTTTYINPLAPDLDI